jgi:hypothetical protein
VKVKLRLAQHDPNATALFPDAAQRRAGLALRTFYFLTTKCLHSFAAPIFKDATGDVLRYHLDTYYAYQTENPTRAASVCADPSLSPAVRYVPAPRPR